MRVRIFTNFGGIVFLRDFTPVTSLLASDNVSTTGKHKTRLFYVYSRY